MDRDDYRRPGALTVLTAEQAELITALDPAPIELCRVAQGLLILPDNATGAGLSARHLEQRNVRSAARLVQIAQDLSNLPLDQPRATDQRVVGTCRHFALVSTAFLRAKGIAARCRCGFAAYFQPGLHVDHWVTEYWDEASQRWVRIDSEILGFGLLDRSDDLAPGEFLTGGEAWQAYRNGNQDAMAFGVHGTQNWGPAEIVGNLIRDLAALNKVEMLPWDEWGPMQTCYDGGIDGDIEHLMDAVAEACGTENDEIISLYNTLRVPNEMIV